MPQDVYVDLLFLINFSMDYLCLYICTKILHRKIKTYRKLSLTVPGRLERSVSEHREIYEAIAAGDAKLADKLTSLHIERALENMLCAL